MLIMFHWPRSRLATSQWKVITSALSNISQAIILFSLTAFFTPEAVNLNRDFSTQMAISFLFSGLLLFILGVIITKP